MADGSCSGGAFLSRVQRISITAVWIHPCPGVSENNQPNKRFLIAALSVSLNYGGCSTLDDRRNFGAGKGASVCRTEALYD